jgi:hypothetical protein
MIYEITNKKWESGAIIAEYDDETGGFINIKNQDLKMSWEEAQRLCIRFPINVHLIDVCTRAGLVFRQLSNKPLVFVDFYNAYGVKQSKVDAIKAWKKLSEEDQKRAFAYIRKYDMILASETWRKKMLPASYINRQLWKDNE